MKTDNLPPFLAVLSSDAASRISLLGAPKGFDKKDWDEYRNKVADCIKQTFESSWSERSQALNTAQMDVERLTKMVRARDEVIERPPSKDTIRMDWLDSMSTEQVCYFFDCIAGFPPPKARTAIDYAMQDEYGKYTEKQ